MRLNRTDDEDGLQLTNPTTRCTHTPTIVLNGKQLTRDPLVYGYDGIILEVLESSQVVSITLF